MANFNNVNILVVEDDRDSRDLLFRILEKTGAKVTIAETGEKAIELIKNDLSIKIVLMDIRLPDIDGFITTRKIKDLRPNLPVIAQTAYAMYNDKELCLENGCDDYISKPLNRNLLFDILNKYLYN